MNVDFSNDLNSFSFCLQAMYLPWVLAIFNMIIQGGYVLVVLIHYSSLKNNSGNVNMHVGISTVKSKGDFELLLHHCLSLVGQAVSPIYQGLNELAKKS